MLVLGKPLYKADTIVLIMSNPKRKQWRSPTNKIHSQWRKYIKCKICGKIAPFLHDIPSRNGCCSKKCDRERHRRYAEAEKIRLKIMTKDKLNMLVLSKPLYSCLAT